MSQLTPLVSASQEEVARLDRLDHYIPAYKKIFPDLGGVYLGQTTEAMCDRFSGRF